MSTSERLGARFLRPSTLICIDSNELGLREKADAVIGAFAEWVGAKYLMSDNRHFLQELKTDAFEVISPAEFLDRFSKGAL